MSFWTTLTTWATSCEPSLNSITKQQKRGTMRKRFFSLVNRQESAEEVPKTERWDFRLKKYDGVVTGRESKELKEQSPNGTIAFPCERKEKPMCNRSVRGLENSSLPWMSFFLFRFKMASKRPHGEHCIARGRCQRARLGPAKVIVSKRQSC